MLRRRRPLLWVCLFLAFGGLLCNMLAFILPYWFARFPNSKNRFLRLGLWEICLHEYMPQDLGNIMYTGCFFLFDPQIYPLRSNFIRTWFFVCQIFYTLCFVSYMAAVVVLLSEAVNLVSPRGPRAVLFCILTTGSACVFLLITLTVMGAGVDSEGKRKPVAEQDWLQSLDQCSLSWSYGLAACSLPGCLLTCAILSCFVYPKRSHQQLLSVTAWSWPSLADWTCLHNRSSSYNSTSRSHSYPSRSVASGEVRTHSTPSERNPARPTLTFRDPLVSATPSGSSGRHRTHSSTPVSQTTSHGVHSAHETVSRYDPRSPDSISLQSYEAPFVRDEIRSSRFTSAKVRPNRTRESLNAYAANTFPNEDSDLCLSDTLHPSSATLTCKTPPKLSAAAQRTGTSSGSGLRSADTSVWTTNSLSVQAARPMRKERDHQRTSSRSSSRLRTTSSSAADFGEELVNQPENNSHPSVHVQAAKKMKRKS